MELRHNEAVAYRRAVELLKEDGAPKRIPNSWEAAKKGIYRLAAEAETDAAYLAKDHQRTELMLSAAGFWFAAGEFRKVQATVRNALRGPVSLDLQQKLLDVSAAAGRAIEQNKIRDRLIQEAERGEGGQV